MLNPCLEAYVAFAHRLADASGEVIRRHFRTPFAVDCKADRSPVTLADREAELAMRALIGETYPEHGIEGEEFGAVRADADYLWSIDPIDGTRSFVTGRPLFGTLVALVHRGAPVLGVIDQPILRERWVGVRGRGTSLGGVPIRTRACPALADATVSTTSPMLFDAGEREAFERLAVAAGNAVFGGDCYGYGLLAAGFVDLVVEAGLQRYDYLALLPVIEEAGGVVTGWSGEPVGARPGGRLLAAGDRRVHAEAVALLRGTDDAP
jgi:inositol-phosphate phosphatase / L-galactose 1-phosphate phosphatase / histidinol-phosphatase